MSSIKAIVLLCVTGAIAVSICSAEGAKSQTNSDSKQSSARSYISGANGQGVIGQDPNSYMNQVFQHKPVELLHLVPILLLLAFIPLVLPLIFQLFAGIMTPFNSPFSHGRRRRDTNFHKNPEISQLLLDLAKKVGDSLEKFNEFSK